MSSIRCGDFCTAGDVARMNPEEVTNKLLKEHKSPTNW